VVKILCICWEIIANEDRDVSQKDGLFSFQTSMRLIDRDIFISVSKACEEMTKDNIKHKYILRVQK
jgi:hypothetical protein